jgi:hypothetical protein
MASRILAQEIEGSRPSDIEWILMVETGRKATQKEIRELCAGKWKASLAVPPKCSGLH